MAATLAVAATSKLRFHKWNHLHNGGCSRVHKTVVNESIVTVSSSRRIAQEASPKTAFSIDCKG